jgi:hypothetical protein
MAHYTSMTKGRLFEVLHVGGIVPGQLTPLADSTVPVHCDYADDHDDIAD